MPYFYYLAILLIAFQAGCSMKTPEVNYYSLVDTSQSAVQNLQHPNLTIT